MMMMVLMKMVVMLTKKNNKKAIMTMMMMTMIKKVVTFERQDWHQWYQRLAIFRARQDGSDNIGNDGSMVQTDILYVHFLIVIVSLHMMIVMLSVKALS